MNDGEVSLFQSEATIFYWNDSKLAKGKKKLRP